MTKRKDININSRKVKQPSLRARRTAEILSENIAIPIGQAMIQAGFSPISAANPGQLTRSASWATLMEKYLPESNVAKAHMGLLNASSLVREFFSTEFENLTDEELKKLFTNVNCEARKIVHTKRGRYIYFWSPDNRARKDALDMAYKLRGSYAAEKHTVGLFSLADLGAKRAELETQKDIEADDDRPLLIP